VKNRPSRLNGQLRRRNALARVATTIGWLFIIGGLFSVGWLIGVVYRKRIESPPPQAIEQPSDDNQNDGTRAMPMPVNGRRHKSRPARIKKRTPRQISEYRYADGAVMPDRN
jgi:hypothetical protein